MHKGAVIVDWRVVGRSTLVGLIGMRITYFLTVAILSFLLFLRPASGQLLPSQAQRFSRAQIVRLSVNRGCAAGIVSRDGLYSVGPICGTVLQVVLTGRISMWERIESLFFAFCGLVFLCVVMTPSTERFLGRIFPWWFKAFLTSVLAALFLSLILFGIFGIFAQHGMNLIQRHPISFIVVSGIGTALLLWGNTTIREYNSNL